MKLTDFQIEFEQIRQVFGEKFYTQNRTSRIWKQVQHLEPLEFRKIVEELIEDFRYAPLPKDFREAVRRLPFKSEEFDEATLEICNSCNGLGFLYISETDFPYLAIRCTCHVNAQLKEWAQFPVAKYYHATKRFPNAWFKPDKTEIDGIWAKAARWKKHLQKSLEYWGKQN